MKNLELFMNMVKSMEGLDVSLKIGKESELVIKGDFMAIANTIGTILDAQSRSADARMEIARLKEDIID